MRARLPLRRRQILLGGLLVAITCVTFLCLFSAYEQCSENCRSFNAQLCASVPLPVRGVVSSALPNDRLFRHPVQDGTDRSLLEPTAIRINERRAERQTDKENDEGHPSFYQARNTYDDEAQAVDESADGQVAESNANTQLRTLQGIDCVINDEYTVDCLGDLRKREVFVPFSFLERYFEVGGRLDVSGSRFEWTHSGAASGSTFVRAFTRYSVHGAFMNFASYNVEARERVLCVTSDGVPMSTQWNSRGHFYPTQIAQFGLSHYSRLFDASKSGSETQYDSETDSCVAPRSLLDGGSWRTRSSRATVRLADGALRFDAAEGLLTAAVDASEGVFRELLFDYRFGSATGNFSVTLLLNATLSSLSDSAEHDGQSKSSSLTRISVSYLVASAAQQRERTLHVDLLNSTLQATYYVRSECGQNGSHAGWCSFARNVLVDAKKAFAIVSKHGPVTIGSGEWWFSEDIPTHGAAHSSDSPTSNQSNSNNKLQHIALQSVSVSGAFSWRNVQLCENSGKGHAAMFMNAVRWFVRRQDANGGWPVTVSRKFPFETLNAPWYSAMAHGQALSLLVRGYFHANDERYLHVAVKCISLFGKRGVNGGFRATFMDKFVWFEEYPTANATFVLNGFIYSLLGLFDLREALRAATAGQQLHKSSFSANALAAHLHLVSNYYEEGLLSLKALLPLFDSGSGSFYDLRHVTMPMLPPNVARWDYHTTHINQLNILYTIEQYEPFKRVAERWTEYMKGKRAPHN